MTLEEALALAQGRATILVSDHHGRTCAHWHAEVIAQARAAKLHSPGLFDYEVLASESPIDTDRFATVEDIAPRRRSARGHRHADSSLS